VLEGQELPRKLLLNCEFWEAAAPEILRNTHPGATVTPSIRWLITGKTRQRQQVF
jgi:hypothetical protein